DTEDPAESLRRCFRREARELGDSRLDGCDLTQVHEARDSSDRSGEKRRARARRPYDEDEAVVETSEPLTERCAASRREPLRNAKLVRGRLEDRVHGAIVAARKFSAHGASSIAKAELGNS